MILATSGTIQTVRACLQLCITSLTNRLAKALYGNVLSAECQTFPILYLMLHFLLTPKAESRAKIWYQ